MRYCQDCGEGHDCTAQAETAAVNERIEIARLETKRDVEVARINANLARDELATAEDIAETQADAEVESAIAEAEVIGAAIEAGIQPEPEPVIIDAPEPVADDEPAEDAPPEVEGSVPPPAAKRKVGLGAW